MRSRGCLKTEGQTGRIAGLFLMLLFFLLTVCFPARADAVNLEVTYGYQNTAKAGHYLPLTIVLDNTQEETFSGYVYVYMADSDKRLYQYRYQAIAEAGSSAELKVNVALGGQVNQLLVKAVRRDGTVLGSRRIGLDVNQSGAELLLGILSDNPEKLSYFNDVRLNDGLLHTRTVTLDSSNLPKDETELDQLDVILVTDFDMSGISEAEARCLRRWAENGGILIFGSGKNGAAAMSPWFSELLQQPLVPARVLTAAASLLGTDSGEQRYSLWLSPVYLENGRELFSMDGLPLLTELSEGSGLIAAAAYDFCELQRFATEHESYAGTVLTAVLGQSRLAELSVSSAEQSQAQYESLEGLMNLSDLSKLPHAGLYMLLLFAYALLAGPLLYYIMRSRGALRLYRPSVLLLSVFFTLAIWVLGISTRFNGTFLTYAKLRDVSAESVDETDYINVRSSDRNHCGLEIRTEYYVYPVQRGEGFAGDLQKLADSQDTACTDIFYDRESTRLDMRNEDPFTAGYFELHNKMPNGEGCFTGSLILDGEQLRGTIQNNTGESLTDAAVLLYGRLCPIGSLAAGESVTLDGLPVLQVPVGQSGYIASLCTGGSGQSFLSYYLENNMSSYFSNARLIGFVREDSADFVLGKGVESYGVTMVTAALPLSEIDGEDRSYAALSRDPELVSGDYEERSNSISGKESTILTYHLGDNAEITGLRAMTAVQLADTEDSALTLFRGSICFYNYESGGYDSISLTEPLDEQQLAPYLNDSNALQVRYTPRNDSSGQRQYLPMLLVRCREQSVQTGSGAVLSIQSEGTEDD